MMDELREPGRGSVAADGPALAGCLEAQRLCRRVAGDPNAPLVCGIVGVGGSGKTALLEALAGIYLRAGVRVHRQVPAAGRARGGDTVSNPAPDTVTLVDDAHLLSDEQVHRLCRMAADGAAGLVVCYRPWPRPPALAELSAALARFRAPVVLGPLDREGTAARAAAHLGAEPRPGLVDLLCEQTGGLPAQVDRLTTALREAGTEGDDPDNRAGAPPSYRVPPGVLEQVRHDLERTDPAVRDVLLALAVDVASDVPPDTTVLASGLGLEHDAVSDALQAAHAAGLLPDGGRPIGLARRALVRFTPVNHQRAVRERLAMSRLERGGSVLTAARGLLDAGAVGPRAAGAFVAAGDQALREGSPLAADLLAAAVEAGAPPDDLAGRRAHAAAIDGDLDTALRLADHGVAASEAPDRARAVAVMAAVFARRGLLARSAELYRWLGRTDANMSPALAAVPLIGAGLLGDAEEALAAAGGNADATPTLVADVQALMGRGIHQTVAGSTAAGLSQLVRAAGLLEASGDPALLPDTPAALAALVAAHRGELDVAWSVLDRAVVTGRGGPAVLTRHRLLRAWVAMVRGDVTLARGMLDDAAGSRRLEPRDEFLAAALEVGIARRRSDVATLRDAWPRARRAILEHPADLFDLQPLGEFAVAAARLRDEDWVAPFLRDGHGLLERLGNPVLWTAPLHWYRFHAAAVSERPPAAKRHAAALTRAATDGGYVAALAAAARCWLRVLADDVDPSTVESAARGLHGCGLTWDAARLAGQAAIRTPDKRAMVALLDSARALNRTLRDAPAPQPPGREPGPRSVGDPSRLTRTRPDGALSEREREVAELLLAGLTYKEIGERLFISAKTVEHHVARVRRRLGSSSRWELFTRLRELRGDRLAG